jgi:hypothetical protein
MYSSMLLILIISIYFSWMMHGKNKSPMLYPY